MLNVSVRELHHVEGWTNKIALVANDRLRKVNSREETNEESDFGEPVVGAGFKTRPYKPYQPAELLAQAARSFR